MLTRSMPQIPQQKNFFKELVRRADTSTLQGQGGFSSPKGRFKFLLEQVKGHQGNDQWHMKAIASNAFMKY